MNRRDGKSRQGNVKCYGARHLVLVTTTFLTAIFGRRTFLPPCQRCCSRELCTFELQKSIHFGIFRQSTVPDDQQARPPPPRNRRLTWDFLPKKVMFPRGQFCRGPEKITRQPEGSIKICLIRFSYAREGVFLSICNNPKIISSVPSTWRCWLSQSCGD